MSNEERVCYNDKYKQEGDGLKESWLSYRYLSSLVQGRGCSCQTNAFQVLGRQTPAGETAGSVSNLRMQKSLSQGDLSSSAPTV